MQKNVRSFLIFFLAALFCVGWGPCATTSNGPEVQGNAAAKVRDFLKTVEPGLRPSAKVACSFYLSYATTDKDRADLKANIFAVSSIVSGTSADLNPGDLSRNIQAALPASPENKSLADGITGAWAIALPFIQGDPALLIKVTQDLAAGCVDATK